VVLSAKRGEGLDELLRRIEAALAIRWMLREMDLAPARSAKIADIYACAPVIEQRPRRGRIRLRLRVTPENWKRLMHRFTSRALPAAKISVSDEL
jgi:50S ribosomal subunit-associated GTPase HflX